MKIHFRDVQTGMVEARAIIEIEEGVFLNEVTLLNVDGQLVIEFPRKNFKGKNDKMHHLDIITFENEDKQVLWELQIKQAYRDWRKENRKVLVYEDKPIQSDDNKPREERPRKRTFDDKPRRSYSDRGEKPRRSYSDRDDRPKRSYSDREDKPRRSYSDRDDKPRRSYSDRDDRPKRSYSDRDDRPKRSYSDKDDRPKRSYSDKDDRPKRTYSDRDDRPKRERSDGASRPRRQSSDSAPKRQYKRK